MSNKDDIQRQHARNLIEWGFAEKLTLVRVSYPGTDPYGDLTGIAIIGNSITWGSVDVWKMNGAHIEELETLYREES